MDNHQDLLQELLRQEEELQFDAFTNDDALRLGLVRWRGPRPAAKPSR